MLVTREVKEPVYLPFNGDRQLETGLSKSSFRRSLYRLPRETAELIERLLAEKPAADG
jgi:hypothetical protein